MSTQQFSQVTADYVIVAINLETGQELHLKGAPKQKYCSYQWVPNHHVAWWMPLDIAKKTMQALAKSLKHARHRMSKAYWNINTSYDIFGQSYRTTQASGLFGIFLLDEASPYLIEVRSLKDRALDRKRTVLQPIRLEGGEIAAFKARLYAWHDEMARRANYNGLPYPDQVAPAAIEKLKAYGMTTGWDIMTNLEYLTLNQCGLNYSEYLEVLFWLNTSGHGKLGPIFKVMCSKYALQDWMYALTDQDIKKAPKYRVKPNKLIASVE